MPCTWLQQVGVWMSSNSSCQCLEQGSMRRMRTPIPCCTGQPKKVTVRWHVISLQNSSSTHRTGTRCVGSEGTALVSECKVYMHANMYACFRLCSEAYVVTKQVSLGHVYVMFMYSPVFCLQGPIPLFLFGNASPMYSVHKLQPASNSRML